jgi:predicted lipoprotein with Yx(FWY)xxD motif
MRTRTPPILILAAAVGLTVAVAGCGGGSNSSSAPPTAPDGKPATLGVAKHNLGTILVDSKGRTLYLFARDSGTKSTCTGACLTCWPPLTANGKPTVGSGANASLIGSARQSDGSKQVVYNGHLLYLYAGDASPGDESGQNVNAYGGIWQVVAPSGDAITATVRNGSGGGY